MKTVVSATFWATSRIKKVLARVIVNLPTCRPRHNFSLRLIGEEQAPNSPGPCPKERELVVSPSHLEVLDFMLDIRILEADLWKLTVDALQGRRLHAATAETQGSLWFEHDRHP